MSTGPQSDAPLRATITSYDGHAERFRERRKDRSFNEEIADAFAAAIPEGGLVADAGCGPGYDAVALLDRGLRVVSLDLSSGMLALARDVVPGRCIQADLRALPLAPGSLDGIWAMASLVHLSHDDVQATLREFHATLAPGGTLFTLVKNAASTTDAPQSRDEPDTTGRGRSGWRQGRDGPDDRRWFVYWDAQAYDRALEAAGFRILGGSDEDVWIRRFAIAEPPQAPNLETSWRIRVLLDRDATSWIEPGTADQSWAVETPANSAACLAAMRATPEDSFDPTMYSTFRGEPGRSPEQEAIHILETIDKHLADHRRRADRDDWTDVLEVRGARLTDAVRSALLAIGYVRFRPEHDGFVAYRPPEDPPA